MEIDFDNIKYFVWKIWKSILTTLNISSGKFKIHKEYQVEIDFDNIKYFVWFRSSENRQKSLRIMFFVSIRISNPWIFQK